MAAAVNVDQQLGENPRRYLQMFSGHITLRDLKKKARELENHRLFTKDIGRYPQPEFSATRLRHDTDSEGLKGIEKDKGFRDPFDATLQLLWWSLDIGDDEITRAAEKHMMTNPPDELVRIEPSDLRKFATSPAFQESSRLGAFRFTFPLEKVLQEYRQQVQYCCETERSLGIQYIRIKSTLCFILFSSVMATSPWWGHSGPTYTNRKWCMWCWSTDHVMRNSSLTTLCWQTHPTRFVPTEMVASSGGLRPCVTHTSESIRLWWVAENLFPNTDNCCLAGGNCVIIKTA